MRLRALEKKDYSKESARQPGREFWIDEKADRHCRRPCGDGLRCRPGQQGRLRRDEKENLSLAGDGAACLQAARESLHRHVLKLQLS